MSDQQCGLCLSCGAPFLPDIDDIDFFNREANLSVLFLNTQFKQNPEIQRTYDVPKLCSKRQASHIVHVSYHQTALDYMCNRHTDDNDVGIGAGFNMVGGSAVPDLANAPFLYYHTASTKEGPKAATWARPPEDRRIDMGDLLDRIEEAYDNDPVHAQPFQPGRMYDICAGCNALMTQKSHFRFLLGCRGAGAKNMRGCIVARDAFTQYNVESRRHALPDAYGVWQVQNGGVRRAPRRIKTDSEAPAIAYYLHMCLPHQGAGQQNYFNRFRPTALRLATRQVYLELCWVILEIACLATLLDEGTATKPRETKRSHGRHQHLGVLDLYVSYFFWRLAVYCLGGRKQMDFVQFHQKFFSDARNCPGLLPESSRRVTTGSLMYSASSQSAKGLVEEICSYLMFYFKNELQPLVELCCGGGDVDKPIKEYFLQFDVVRILRARSNEVSQFVCVFTGFLLYDRHARRPPATTSSQPWENLGSTRFYSGSSTYARATRRSSSGNSRTSGRAGSGARSSASGSRTRGTRPSPRSGCTTCARSSTHPTTTGRS